MEARERSGEATRERRKREGEKCKELKMERKREKEEKRSKEREYCRERTRKNNPREPAVVGHRGVHKPMHSNYFFLILCHCQASDCSCKLFVWQFW